LIENITNNLIQYRKQIEYFLNTLQDEKKYFNLNMDRLMKWEFVLIEQVDNKIIAVAGLERKWGIVRNNVIVKAEYQRQGRGTKILYELIDQTKERYALLMAVISEDNLASLGLHLKTGYKMIGRRQTLHYLIRPVNRKGTFLYYLLITLFPLIKVADLIRR
jgi:RimJ/RimL family protein N-acetyltransferase